MNSGFRRPSLANQQREPRQGCIALGRKGPTDITNGGDMRMAEPSSGMIDTAGENCITRLDGAVGVRRTTQSKTAFANLIAATEFV